MQWFLDRGCEIIKVCADPGDLILWDSRTVHYNCLPESDAVRSVLCKFTEKARDRSRYPDLFASLVMNADDNVLNLDMCYTPASYAKPDDLALKAQLFMDRKGTVGYSQYIFCPWSP